MSIRVRIAPSPTGDPHVGTAYIALFNYAFAKHNNGKFILRIEDTDRARSTRESEDGIMRALRWIGLNWDEGPDIGGEYGPYRQSERTELYKKYANILIDNNSAYYCFCAEDRLKSLRASGVTGYDGACKNLSRDNIKNKIDSGEKYVIRLAMPKDGICVIDDGLRGNVTYSNSEIDDQILLKSDGFPTYHLANVVDDHLMNISHVIRAEEWLPSTPKHLRLYSAFGWTPPKFFHMPLLRNPDKSKISKRKCPVSLDYYKDAGFLPEALLNFLGLLGYSFGGDREKFSLNEFINTFSWDKISLGGPIFNIDKLTWLNSLYIRDLSVDELVNKIIDWKLGTDNLKKIVPLIHQRMNKLSDFVPSTDFLFADAVDVTGDFADLKGLVDILDNVSWNAAALEKACRDYCVNNNLSTKDIFMKIRLVVTGKYKTPPLFSSMEILGKDLCRRRLRDKI